MIDRILLQCFVTKVVPPETTHLRRRCWRCLWPVEGERAHLKLSITPSGIVSSSISFTKGATMFSNWFTGAAQDRYRMSPHKQRIDDLGKSLLELRYANEVIRQHLHEWLRFSHYLVEKSGGSFLQAPGADTIRRYPAGRSAVTSASRFRVLRVGQNLCRGG